MRQALEEKEDAKSLKQKTRERVRPKMGKLTIDYQKLHDAFFRSGVFYGERERECVYVCMCVGERVRECVCVRVSECEVCEREVIPCVADSRQSL